MKQTQAGSRQDAVKRRREYLRTIYVSRTALIVGCATGLSSAMLLFVLISTYYSSDPEMMRVVYTMPQWLYWWWGEFVDLASGPAPVVSSLCIAGLCSIFLSYRSARKLKTLPYVLPVAEHLATLPAEEILLRHSDQPNAVLEELLRAARAGETNEAVELLRAGVEGQKG